MRTLPLARPVESPGLRATWRAGCGLASRAATVSGSRGWTPGVQSLTRTMEAASASLGSCRAHTPIRPLTPPQPQVTLNVCDAALSKDPSLGIEPSMAEKPRHPTNQLDAWQVESLRLTSFPDPSKPLPSQDWWSALVGLPPDSETRRPREAVTITTGPFAGGTLTLSIQPGRIEWLLSALPPTQSPETPGFPLIGPFPDTNSTFHALGMRWLQRRDCPPLTRLAFGAILLTPVKDRKAGYIALQPYLCAVKLDPDHSSDLQYRINRPRPSQHCRDLSLTINRLSSWSVAQWQSHSLIFAAGASPEQIQLETAYALHLVLDINTNPRNSETLPPDKLSAIWEELAGLAPEIMLQGDIP